MDLFLSAADRRRGLVTALYERVREAIAEGRVRPGEPLPPSRALAEQLSISRHTVTTAYGYLVAEGFLVGARGGGTCVAPDLEALQGSARRERTPPRAVDPAEPTFTIDARLGFPDATLFPFAEWKTQTTRALRSLRTRHAGRPVEPEGLRVLREAIAAWVLRSRGVRASADTVLVTSGAQQAFDVLLRTLTQPGDTVVMEDPGYSPFRALAQSLGRLVTSVPVDAQGLVTHALPRRAKLVYVTPSHQFPLGSVLSLPRRLELLEWARRTGALIIEDDYDTEYRFAGRPLEPLQRLAPQRVLYVGTFSKVLAPELRLGFMVAPAAVIASLAATRALLDWHSPLVAQHTLARFLREGQMERHLKRARPVYQARHDAIVAWLEGPGKALGRPWAVGAGLHVAISLDHIDERELLTRAAERRLGLEGLSRWAARAPVNGLGLGFGGVPTSAVPALLDQLSALAKPRRRRERGG